MAKTDRLFDIIQILRNASGPVLAADLARLCEVSERTIYRDMATLQARQVPIYGAAGIGYVMRKGYDLPPVTLDRDEAEAVILGLSMIARTSDQGLWRAARRAARKLHAAAPGVPHLIASTWGAPPPKSVSASALRDTIRAEQALHLSYLDADAQASSRIIWPLTLIYYAQTEVLVAFCTLRQDFRHFRLDRIAQATPLPQFFHGQSQKLRADWTRLHKDQAVESIPL